MKLWAAYIKERFDAEIIYDEVGFLTYFKKSDNEIFILDIYVLPEHRNKKVFFKFTEQLRLKENPKIVYGQSCLDAKNWEQSDSFIRSWGFKEILREGDMVYYKYEVE